MVDSMHYSSLLLLLVTLVHGVCAKPPVEIQINDPLVLKCIASESTVLWLLDGVRLISTTNIKLGVQIDRRHEHTVVVRVVGQSDAGDYFCLTDYSYYSINVRGMVDDTLLYWSLIVLIVLMLITFGVALFMFWREYKKVDKMKRDQEDRMYEDDLPDEYEYQRERICLSQVRRDGVIETSNVPTSTVPEANHASSASAHSF